MTKFAVAKAAIATMAAAGAVMAAAPAAAQGCTRETLQGVADSYGKAQAEGSVFNLPIGEWLDYRENMKMSSSASGVISQPMEFAWKLELLDTGNCRVFVEGVVLEPKPYVLATQLNFGYFGVGQMNTVVTDEGDWLFDAAKTYEYARRENWDTIPEDRRNTREELLAAANAYLDLFKDKSVQVPWGTPCARLEGGIYTGKGTPEDTCNVGVPEGVDLAEREYIVDETKGAVAVMLRFGGPKGRPDAHTFRIEDGKIRYVHTVTNCGDEVNCGFPPLAEMLKKNPEMQPVLKN
ncbi:hypothetical protein GRI75_14100 [Altererythrobacter soli]|uniref:DUF8021 domain-containing protein n=1 Tax=Croceibacterium soli TaxID=1739690 RepID=A0A6I4V1A8_9SPHN|nr:hypothetical protein [Croceibacterium soli]MXP42775.1 hypothetical protein [Croceibacterium soli]